MAITNDGFKGQTVFEFLRKHQGMTTAEIACALGKTHASVAGILAQLFNHGRVIKTSNPEGGQAWYVNNLPFGCSNPTLMLFNRLLTECRHAAN
ncbi:MULTISPECIES: helix-turn-helix transcriptional regulator [Lelliottia]|uniref:Transcriptional regulator HTH-type FeoC domain-containing protein n=1 Tax=Lelliottia aquatilis TaxID=2080838 RepID=A0ABX5A2Q7_9ENTR|nr:MULTISPECIES: helix-turn-helix transcriptional regulator [Lelliottia]POZ14092.1 hypothetical protein C3Z09_20155 [Lelliottia aquatilis]POZ23994.1 hypothetical protein C3712_07160 [Lelliottia aquatilis]POZ27604.1 hypothetical protein C3708_08495 [Lelliottia sp. 7254-16]POZ29873.1 hypothetical protein C3711_01705 [Lelliottia aquatilis]POZ35438.1 hypothetical protein C3710_01705 [Lelliottia aquatilis]